MAKHFGDRVDITWKSFLLRTEPKVTARSEFVSYTQGWARMMEMEPRTEFNPWTMDGADTPPDSSLPAHIAAKVVEANWPEATEDLHWRLLRAYFTENRNIADWPVLRELVAEVGVDPDDFTTMAGEQRKAMAELVITEHNSAIEQGITAVPTVLINHVLPVPGAQETESYINWIGRLIERQNDDTAPTD